MPENEYTVDFKPIFEAAAKGARKKALAELINAIHENARLRLFLAVKPAETTNALLIASRYVVGGTYRFNLLDAMLESLVFAENDRLTAIAQSGILMRAVEKQDNIHAALMECILKNIESDELVGFFTRDPNGKACVRKAVTLLCVEIEKNPAYDIEKSTLYSIIMELKIADPTLDFQKVFATDTGDKELFSNLGKKFPQVFNLMKQSAAVPPEPVSVGIRRVTLPAGPSAVALVNAAVASGNAQDLDRQIKAIPSEVREDVFITDFNGSNAIREAEKHSEATLKLMMDSLPVIRRWSAISGSGLLQHAVETENVDIAKRIVAVLGKQDRKWLFAIDPFGKPSVRDAMKSACGSRDLEKTVLYQIVRCLTPMEWGKDFFISFMKNKNDKKLMLSLAKNDPHVFDLIIESTMTPDQRLGFLVDKKHQQMFDKALGAIKATLEKIKDGSLDISKQAGEAAQALYDELSTSYLKYKNNPTLASYEVFKTACKTSITKAKKSDLKNYSEMSVLMRNVLLAIAGLGIIYVIAGLVNLAVNKSFLFGAKVDINPRIKTIKEAVEGMKRIFPRKG